MRSGALAGTLVLLANIATLAVLYGKYESRDYGITFYVGSCRTTKATVIGAHVIINVLSTILLVYSNFSMQCLSSPSRNEVNEAHSKSQWLSIGTPTIRNLFFVSKPKIVLWLVLGVSSFPLHMIWNSTIFETKATYDYLAIGVNESFVHGADWIVPPFLGAKRGRWDMPSSNKASLEAILHSLQTEASESKLKRLEVPDCIKEYRKPLLSDRQHVLLVVDNSSASSPESNSSVENIYFNEYLGRHESIWRWVCDRESESNGKECTLTSDGFNYGNWIPGTELSTVDDPVFRNYTPVYNFPLGWRSIHPVSYCLSREVEGQCKLTVLPVFLIIVIACNVIKIVSFVCALWVTKKDRPLCTTGDVIQSFLGEPDPHTRNRCLTTKRDYEVWKLGAVSQKWSSRSSTSGDQWTGERHCWRQAVSGWQWLIFVTVAIAIILGAWLGIISQHESIDWASNMANGFGDPTSGSISVGEMNIPRYFAIANLPQVAVSYVYLTLNNILTTMLAMAEWCAFVTDPSKGLRVSSPMPGTSQRSTYFLSLPYKWAIPTTVAIALLHWLVSQMLFFAQIDIYQMSSEGKYSVSTQNNVYQSRFAGIFAVSIAIALLVALFATALIGLYPEHIPLSGCSSASIAAACQPFRLREDEDSMRGFDPDLPFQKLYWGVVEDPDSATDNIGHATFSASSVTTLVKEKIYA